MTLRVVIDRKAFKYLTELPEKSRRLITEKCHALADYPFPGQGDKELLHLEYNIYRMHVVRSFTVFYQIAEDDKLIRILEIATIEKAHKLYKRMD